jgi:excinuclease ABC subunit A
MTIPGPASAIRLRGVRHNNLKNFDLDIPVGRLTVITGLSGSGKSSLAFDTLFAEGQRRYIETFSPYARQFFDRMDKPQVDRIDGIPPAIAIEQRNSVRNTRSTVGTMTELCEYLKLLWPNLARLHCRQCGQPVRREPPQVVWETVSQVAGHSSPELLITFDIPLSAKLSVEESLNLIAKQGYQRLLVANQIVRIDEAPGHPALRAPVPGLTIIQDRLKVTPDHRARFVEACEHAYHFGKGKLTIRPVASKDANKPEPALPPQMFSSGFHCAACDLDYREPTPALFSFNHPAGACPECKGFGRIISIDYDRAIPDRSNTLAGGCIKPWQVGHGLDSQRDLMTFCKASGIPTNVPFEKLPQKLQDWVIQGDPGYGTDDEHEWPRAWYGVKGYFRWLESKSYKMHVRVLLSRYRAYTTCPKCGGLRFNADSLLYRMSTEAHNEAQSRGESSGSHSGRAGSLTLADFYALPLKEAFALVERISASRTAAPRDPMVLVLSEVRARLGYLVEAGLGYLTLDRQARTLSGGETERVNLTTCLGTGLVNTLFVLDEPSVGLHPRDTARLVQILQKLRDTGNTVIVVEHEASVMRAADQIVDLGPGQGEKGGEIVFCGPVRDLLKSERSLTGHYLSGRKRIEIPPCRPVKQNTFTGAALARVEKAKGEGRREAWALAEATAPYSFEPSDRSSRVGWLRISNATRHNLHHLTIEVPLGRFVCLTGVSGSGKTTLAREVLLPALEARLKSRKSISPAVTTRPASEPVEPDEREQDAPTDQVSRLPSELTGWESLSQVVLVDQSALGKTPRSNPVVYIGAFEDIRDLFAQTEPARQRGFNSSAFSFNSGVGQCERCRGAGFEKIEMQFLSDVFIRCPDCNGRRYRNHILEVKLRGDGKNMSIADLLESTVDDALAFLTNFIHLPSGRSALTRLKPLQDVGLGYLRLGQPINTLSGGESQRLKLVSYLADAAVSANEEAKLREQPPRRATNRIASPDQGSELASAPRGTLFLFDEPTTGLHFDDVRVLLQAFQRLVDAGHSLVVIEHNLDVIKCADWVIDLGPEAGQDGGKLVVCGTPADVRNCVASHTGEALRATELS